MQASLPWHMRAHARIVADGGWKRMPASRPRPTSTRARNGTPSSTRWCPSACQRLDEVPATSSPTCSGAPNVAELDEKIGEEGATSRKAPAPTRPWQTAAPSWPTSPAPGKQPSRCRPPAASWASSMDMKLKFAAAAACAWPCAATWSPRRCSSPSSSCRAKMCSPASTR